MMTMIYKNLLFSMFPKHACTGCRNNLMKEQVIRLQGKLETKLLQLTYRESQHLPPDTNCNV